MKRFFISSPSRRFDGVRVNPERLLFENFILQVDKSVRLILSSGGKFWLNMT
jgi:hypothetical protein